LLLKKGLKKLTDVLNDIVPERVLNKGEGVHGDVMDQLCLLRTSGMIDAALENTASMTMGTDSESVQARGVVDELGVIWAKMGQALLNDMISVEVLDERNNVITKCRDDSLNLGDCEQ
jgi:hypothetical protein